MRSALMLVAIASSLAFLSVVHADDDDPDGPKKEEEPDAPPKKKKKKAVVEAVVTPVVASASSSAPPSAEAKDHDTVVGAIGVGYLGQLDVPLSSAGTTLPAQIVGMRYWAAKSYAISAGLGFWSSSSSASAAGTTTEGPSATAFALKGGVAFALASGKHYTFVIEPQLVFGYASQTIKTTVGANTEHSGTRVAIGGTAGAEIQFGFIGIPELALVSSIGLALDIQSGKTKDAGGESAIARNTFTTFTLSNPWNIFSGNVAAIYYF